MLSKKDVSGRAALWSVALAAIGLSTAPCFAYDAPERVRLDYGTDVGSCPDEASFRALVERQLERGAFSDAAPLTMRVQVTRVGDELAGSLSLIGAGDEKATQYFTEGAARCDELVATMSLAAVIAIERLRQSAHDAEPPRVSPPTGRPKAQQPPSRRYRLSTLGGVAFAQGHLPEATLGAVIGMELARDDLRIGLRTEQLASAYGRDPAGVVKVQLSRLELVPCYARWFVAACGVLAAGAMHASGIEASRTRLRTILLPSAGVRAGLRFPFGDIFELQVDVALDLALSRPAVALRDGAQTADVWQASLLGMTSTAVIATRLSP